MESETIANSLQKLLIEERKADLKASAERRRRQNLVSPESKRHGLHPLEILPREVWELIFERLKDPAAIAGVWNACSFFRELIGRDKYFSQVLFPAVLSLKPLKDALQVLQGERRPFVIRASSRRVLSKLRCVSKTWKEGVDHLVTREIEEYDAWRWTGSHFSWTPFFRLTSDVGEYQLLNRMLDDLGNENRRGSPLSLINHSLEFIPHFRMGNMEHVQALLLSKLNIFLRAFGHEVFRFALQTETLWIPELGLTPKDYYLMIRTWISQMPRLKRLDMHLPHLFPIHGFRQGEPELLDLQDALKSQPFPCLKSLRSLTLDGARIPQEMFMLALYTAILNSNSKSIKDLEVELDFLRHSTHEVDVQFRAAVHALGNLESLHVFVGEHLWFSDPTPCFNLNWKLKRLSLTHGVTLSSQLFRLLESYPTLEWLYLGLIFNEESRFDSPFLHLPNVTKVTLRITSPTSHFVFINVDFLLPMKKLSVLKWKEMGNHDIPLQFGSSELIQFQRGRCDLYRSNIWEVFPALALIEVEQPKSKKVYKRGLRV